MSLLAVWRAPFALRPVVAELPEGLTLAEMADRMPGLPADFAARGVICLAGHPVPRPHWARVRPKGRSARGPVVVTFHFPPRDGGDSGKQVLAIVASIGLSLATGAILGGKSLLGLHLAKGSVASYAAATGLSLIGNALLSALVPPPARPRLRRDEEAGAASAGGNALQPGGAIPRVIGERKVFPPLAAEPLTWFDGPDEVVEAVYCLAGPHRLSDVRIGAAALAESGVEHELREGWAGDDPLRLLTRYGRTEGLQAELRGHLAADDDGSKLDVSAGDVQAALPVPQVVSTRAAPDEHWLQLTFPQGLHEQASDSVRMRVPLRLRMRPAAGGGWINLPELHVQAATIRALRLTVVLDWSGRAATPQAPNAEGFVEARRAAPGQSAAPAQPDWAADASFGAGGDAWLAAGNLGTTGVERVELGRYTARILLDPATFPPGRWEVEIRRGAAFRAGDWSASAYTVSGSVWDLFGYRGVTAPSIPRTRDGVGDTVYLLRSVSVWNASPVPKPGLALIALRARNRAVDAVSCLAGAWVPDWDGTGWRSWAVTDNPAPHLRDIYAGALNTVPVPASLIDEDGLVAWRQACTDAGYRCNAVIEGKSVAEAAALVASCGYARPAMSDLWGVARDYDRSGEAPVQVFTPRNSRGLRWSRAFPRLPDGLRVSFTDEALDWQERQVDVARPGVVGEPVVMEDVAYEGLVTEAEVRQRALYDMAQPVLRGTTWTWDAPAEAIICRRGDLVGLQAEVLAAETGSARIIDRTLDGSGDVTAVTLDAAVPLIDVPDLLSVPDILAVDDMLQLGQVSAAVVRGPDGPGPALELTALAGESAVLTFADPQPAGEVPIGALVVVGPADRVLHRLIVGPITPRADYSATLSGVDEAPDLWTA